MEAAESMCRAITKSERRWLVAVAATLLLAPALAQEPWRFATDARVVAFADVHGAYGNLVALLRATDVIDADLRWNAGPAHVVSLGDLVDRGAETRAVLELLMRLEREAAAAGGRLHIVLGNHELMTLLGDWRYVAPADYASFAADETEAMRAAAYADFAAGAGGDSSEARARFDSTYARGYFARQAAFAPAGRYGAWLLSRPTLVVVNDSAPVGVELSGPVRAQLMRECLAFDRRCGVARVPRRGKGECRRVHGIRVGIADDVRRRLSYRRHSE